MWIMNEADYKSMEAIHIRLVLENAELRRKVYSLEEFKNKHSCPDCDNPMGLGIAERIKCDYCEKEFCSNYGKGDYIYAHLEGEILDRVKYQCRSCKEKNIKLH